MDLRTKTWSTTDVQYAIKKYVCLLNLVLPAGTTCIDDANWSVPEAIKIGLMINDIDISYWLPKNDAVDTNNAIYATIGVSSDYASFLIPTKNGTVSVGIGYNLTHDQVDDLLLLCTCATVLDEYSINKPDLDTNLQCIVGDWNMSKVVSKLSKNNKVCVRCTDHEFRDDVRNLTWVEGYELTGEYPVEGLDSNNVLGKHLISLLTDIST